jgi:hypothetical protein
MGKDMKRYERYEESTIVGYNNRKIIDTNHSIERMIDKTRFVDLDKKQVIWVINNGIEKIINNYKDESTTYGIWSKSTGICIILEWRKDNQNSRDKNNHAVIVTLPPLKKNFKDFHTKSGDIRIIVESYLHSYIMKKFQKEIRYNAHEIKIFKLSENINVTYHEGEIWDSNISYCIEVH